jgi:hypothetical protein
MEMALGWYGLSIGNVKLLLYQIRLYSILSSAFRITELDVTGYSFMNLWIPAYNLQISLHFNVFFFHLWFKQILQFMLCVSSALLI